MADAPTRQVVWDAAAWIALIIDEKIRDPSGKVTQDRGAMARGVQVAAERGSLEIVTPALALVETCGQHIVRTTISDGKVEAYFDHDYVQVAPLDVQISKAARTIVKAKLPSSLPYCRPCDAVYVATAADWNITELHTFDGGLIKLSGQFKTRDGRPIIISYPDVSTAGTPLFSP